MRYCANCEEPIEENAEFCVNCGEPVPKQSTEENNTPLMFYKDGNKDAIKEKRKSIIGCIIGAFFFLLIPLSIVLINNINIFNITDPDVRKLIIEVSVTAFGIIGYSIILKTYLKNKEVQFAKSFAIIGGVAFGALLIIAGIAAILFQLLFGLLIGIIGSCV